MSMQQEILKVYIYKKILIKLMTSMNLNYEKYFFSYYLFIFFFFQRETHKKILIIVIFKMMRKQRFVDEYES